MAKQAAIILLNWNTPKHTANCILSIQKNCNSEQYDLIVADNGSTDGSLAKLQAQFPDLLYIDNQENLGFAAGNNKALELSLQQDYTYSLLLNNDTEVFEDFLTPLINHLEQHLKAVAVQPSIYFLNSKEDLWNGGSFFNKWLGITYSDNQKGVTTAMRFSTVDWITGCCMLVRNDALRKSGLLNSAYFLYFEDVELSFRLKRYGELHYLNTTKIYHEAGVSGKQSSKNKEGTISPIIHYYLSRNKIWFLRKYSNPVFVPTITLYHFFYYTFLMIYFILRNRLTKAKYLYKGIKNGLSEPKKNIYKG